MGGLCRRVFAPAAALRTFSAMGPKRNAAAGAEVGAKRRRKGATSTRAAADVGTDDAAIETAPVVVMKQQKANATRKAPRQGRSTALDSNSSVSVGADRSMARVQAAVCAPAWFEEMYQGSMSDEYKRYMVEEWGHEKRGDAPLFEKLCLEGAQAGLSWATILAKRKGYREAFHNFDIERCALMSPDEVERLVKSSEATIVRHRGKCQSVGINARGVLQLIAEEKAKAADETAPEHGYFDRYLWSFVGGSPILNTWANGKAVPTETEAAISMSNDLKKRGFKFVGPKICYSLMQSCG